MNCKNYSDIIMKYFDGGLNDIEIQHMKQHLKTCNNCSLEFEDMKEIFGALENSNQIEPPEDFEIKVMEKIKTIKPAWREVPDNTIKFIYGFTSFLLVLLLFMFTMNMMGAGVFESIASRFTVLHSAFDIVVSIRDFVSAILSFVGDLTMAFVRIIVLIVKTYYYIMIFAAVMLFALQWMYVSILRQFQGGHTR